MSDLFAWIVLSVWMSKSDKIVALLFSMTFGGLCACRFLSCGRQKFLHKQQWMYWPNLSCQFRYFVGAIWDSQTQGGQWSPCVYHIFCILGQHHFLNVCLKIFVGRLCFCAAMMKPSVSDPTKLATDGSVKNLHQRIPLKYTTANIGIPDIQCVFHSV